MLVWEPASEPACCVQAESSSLIGGKQEGKLVEGKLKELLKSGTYCTYSTAFLTANQTFAAKQRQKI